MDPTPPKHHRSLTQPAALELNGGHGRGLAQPLVRLAAVRSFARGTRLLLYLSLCLLLHLSLSLGLLLVPQGCGIFCLCVGSVAVLGLQPVSRLGRKVDRE